MPFVLPTFPLQGELVSLQLFTAEDISERYVSWLNDLDVVRYSNQRLRAHSVESCQAYLASFDGTDNLFIGIRRKEDNLLIGTMTAYISRHHGTADMGIMVGEKAVWGMGYGQQAWDTLLKALLQQPAIRKVTAGTLECNAAMQRLAERSGMQFEGARKQQEIVDGRAFDVRYFGRFRDV
ncbi:GNAT family N-acetyltransferase [Herbaspirillum robiniae]|uniref:GNAT family N-acetyltransferase n=1 Tax=Herbaspirillum robiniae TaxID=2014887 RepID=A0ABX2M624_9BURK|nr:GNAT family protein [Herbaspirillum robiniae]NUU03191.1 GNAT family N-acetyltransferase [Herbaspirillum robiniae]